MEPPIDFVIITALEEEREAVLNKLPDHQKLNPSDEDIRVYFSTNLPVTLPDGSTGIYRIIVMSLVGMGRVKAAAATGDAIRLWRPRYVLLVGIAGGIAANDVKLGDILVSDQIVDYELQKQTSERSQIRWNVHRADPRLVLAAGNFVSKDWQQIMIFKRPDEGVPTRHIGPIASGDKVIAFSEVLTRYRDTWPKLIGVEMEASGVATAAFEAVEQPGFFMVRGVSDLADEMKGSSDVEQWRSYACDIAASYAISLLKSGPVPLLFADEEQLGNKQELPTSIDNVPSDINVPQYVQSIKLIAERWSPIVPLTLQQESTLPDILSFTVRVQPESKSAGTSESLLFDAIQQFQQIVLVGEPGTGKTISLWQLALHQCEGLEKIDLQKNKNGIHIPVLIDLAGYDGEAIDELIYRSFQAFGQTITVDSIANLARQGQLLLLFDDFDLAKAHQLPHLLLSLKKWKLAHQKCSIIITTHRPSDGHKLGLSTFRLLPLSSNQAQQILQQLPEIDPGDALAILNNLPADSRHLTTSPLTLRMMAYVYVNFNHRVPQSRGPLYQEVVSGIFTLSEEKGLIEFDRSDKIRLLALLAEWMQNNEVYVLSPVKISSLFDEWILGNGSQVQLAHLQSYDLLHLRSEISQSGFLRTNLNGDVEFIHPTFRAYFAALTISVEQIPLILSKNSWRTSIILWASIQERYKTDPLIDLIVKYPILLGQIIRERTERRDETIRDELELQTYFEIFNQFFKEFLKQFPVLLKDLPWSSLAENRLQLTVTQSSTKDFVLVWQSSQSSSNTVQWTTNAKLYELAGNTDKGFPLPIWILPQKTIQKYHPLEIVYLWVMRALFDLLEFVGLAGGLDVEKFAQHPDTHPAVALIVNRFFLYYQLASRLPPELRDQLPFYASEACDLGIEVHDYMNPPIVLYAVAPGHKPDKFSIEQSVLKRTDDPQRVFKKDEDGNLCFQVEEMIHKVTLLEKIDMGQLMLELPGTAVRNWLKSDLKKYVIGFPPQHW